MGRLYALLQVTRPHNIAAAVLSTIVGCWMAGSRYPAWDLIAAVAVATAAGMTINDLYDFDIDTINRPGRPLPSGALSPRSVWILYIALLLFLVGLLLRLTVVQAGWVLSWVVLLHLYSHTFKRMYLAGNLLVAAVASSGFLLGAYTGGNITGGVIPACYTFFYVFGRELVKDCADIEGDRGCDSKTLPIVSGERAARAAAAVIFGALAITFPIPYFVAVYSRWYGLIIMVSVLPILAASIVLTARGRRLGFVSSLLKTGMFFGIAAFYVAPV